MTGVRNDPTRFKDRFLGVVEEWSGGCLWCGAAADVRPLPASGGQVVLPLCDKHVRWAMASRREGMGKQSRRLRGLVLAWVRLRGGDRDVAIAWLAGQHIESDGRD